MRNYVLAGVIGTLITLLGVRLAIGQSEEVAKIMRQKLSYAQAILEGVSTEDYKKITDSAGAMLALTHRVEWNVIDRPEYLGFSQEFRRALDELVDSAQRRSADGVAYDYVQMTMACVSCHRFVRGVKRA
jgi:hypothetical protein